MAQSSSSRRAWRFNGQDGWLKPESPIRRPVQTGPTDTVTVTARLRHPRGAGGSGRERASRGHPALIISGEGQAPSCACRLPA